MTTGEIIASVIAALSLVISILTAYLTLLSRFQGGVILKRRPILTQVEGVCCLVLECEFVNDGAKPGSIEDILVKANHLQTGSKNIFVPFLVREKFNVFERYEKDDFSTFSAISLGPKSRRELFVVFKPVAKKYDPQNGILVLHTSIRVNAGSKWIESPASTSISLEIDDGVVGLWGSPTGAPQQIEALEISRSRREFLDRQK